MKRLILPSVLLMLAGCSNTVTMPVTDSSKNEVPSWYVESQDSLSKSNGIRFWQKTEYYAAVSSAVSPDRNMAERKAVLHAKNRIADRVYAQFESEETVSYQESGALDQPQGRMRTQYSIKNKVELVSLRGYQVSQQTCLRQTDVNNWICFVEIQIKKSDLDQAVGIEIKE